MKYNISNFLSKYSNYDVDPEQWINEYVVDKLPDHITTIIDFGCGNGRNFLPFSNTSCIFIGFDLHEPNNISWKNNVNVIYYQYSFEDFYINAEKFNIDWEHSLFMTHGSLMYLNTQEEQNNFIDKIKDLGCKNFVLHEYGSEKVLNNLSDHARDGKLGWLNLNETNKKLFNPPYGNVYRFRDFENDFCAHISLV